MIWRTDVGEKPSCSCLFAISIQSVNTVLFSANTGRDNKTANRLCLWWRHCTVFSCTLFAGKFVWGVLVSVLWSIQACLSTSAKPLEVLWLAQVFCVVDMVCSIFMQRYIWEQNEVWWVLHVPGSTDNVAGVQRAAASKLTFRWSFPKLATITIACFGL